MVLMSISTASRVTRKLVHIAFGFCAILLAFLTPLQAAAMAVLALLFNLTLLPHVGGKRIASSARGYDRGILLYPLAVLVLILVFPDRPAVSGTVWAILAFGDGTAALFGVLVRSPRLPWNHTKSVAGLVSFVLFGSVAASLIFMFLSARRPGLESIGVIVLTVLISAGVESLHTNIDDNITVPFAAALTLVALLSAEQWQVPQVTSGVGVWLFVNALLAIAGYAARSVTLSGMIGGWVLGAILILFGGWQMYLVLLAFFVIGSAATRVGYSRKHILGLAQEEGGRRGFSHAFANVGTASLLVLLIAGSSFSPALLFLMAAASLATAAADTAASEIGQLLGRRTFLPISLRPVPRGTEGAISVEGTLASLVAAMIVSLVAVTSFQSSPFSAGMEITFAGPEFWKLVLMVALSAFAGSYLESVVGSWNRKQPARIPNGVLNFMNTMMGAALFLLLWSRTQG